MYKYRRLIVVIPDVQARIKPAFNQVELNFNNPQPELLSWCKKNDILLEAYSPLGSTGANQREIPEVHLSMQTLLWYTRLIMTLSLQVKKLAEKYGVDAANILISWQVQRGVSSAWINRRCDLAQIVLIPPLQVICLPKSVTDSRIESNFKGRWKTESSQTGPCANFRFLPPDVELSSEDLEMLERAAISSPQKRAVDPASSWGLDIFEDAKQKAKL